MHGAQVYQWLPARTVCIPIVELQLWDLSLPSFLLMRFPQAADGPLCETGYDGTEVPHHCKMAAHDTGSMPLAAIFKSLPQIVVCGVV